ncbi:MAG: GNAT family N-acetyltransferase [Acidimicrobiia bacterium]|nr:GNAT family N-acetyltransferase [Acidimicrobiia bacterium]
MSETPQIRTVESVATADLVELYESVEWGAYTQDPAALATAVSNSTYVVEARAGNELIGLARGLSDDSSIFYLQDILVRPDWQRRGVGRALLDRCLERFQHVRTKVLLTDDQPAQHNFYRASGFRDTRDVTEEPLHTFVQMKGL